MFTVHSPLIDLADEWMYRARKSKISRQTLLTRLECWQKNQAALRDLGGSEIYLTPAGSEETVSPKI